MWGEREEGRERGGEDRMRFQMMAWSFISFQTEPDNHKGLRT